MAVYQCPQCELRFRSESEVRDHRTLEHDVDPVRLESLQYRGARHQKPLYPDLVEGADDQRHQVLVISNATLRAERLHDHVAEQSARLDTLFMLVVPAVAPERLSQREETFSTVGTPVGGGTKAVSRDLLAEHRLQEALSRLREAGVRIEGMVGDADPMRAAADALTQFKADEILLSTLPRAHSGWLEANLPEELRRRFGIPVTVVSAA